MINPSLEHELYEVNHIITLS